MWRRQSNARYDNTHCKGLSDVDKTDFAQLIGQGPTDRKFPFFWLIAIWGDMARLQEQPDAVMHPAFDDHK
jgi:hypothetical protein